jgi:hypothetical protein
MAVTNFSSLRAGRAASIEKLNAELKKENTRQGADERFWKLSVDQKTKIGYAKLRFLPAPKGEDVPWQRIFSHAFKLNGGWFIENCPTTLGQRPCPVCKDNSKLWNSGIDADKDVARERKRKLQFISNILVIDDPAHKENNGKIFLFKYGKKIHDKIQELINPQFPDAVSTDPFDMWGPGAEGSGGADFKLKAAQVKGYQNYDNSEFTEPKELFPGDDKAKEAIWDKEYSLTAFVAEDQFKNYEDIEKRFLKVITGNDDGPKTAADAIKRDAPTPADAAKLSAAVDADVDAREEKKTRKPRTKKDATPAQQEAALNAGDFADAAGVADAPEDEDAIKSFFGEMLEE